MEAETTYLPGSLWEDTGLEVTDIVSSQAYAGRKNHNRDPGLQLEGMRRIAHAFVEHPETIHQELVNVAVELCGADSSGISIERPEYGEDRFYHWVATAGEYSGFMDAVLPRFPSACGICLERGRPQLFRVGKKFFDIMGIEAPTVTDGILLPWQVEGTRGTIFIMAHGRREAFDLQDCRTMELLANFAAMGVRQQRQQKMLMAQTKVSAAAAMANDLAHKINNPLQSLTNLIYLAEHDPDSRAVTLLAQQASVDLANLSSLVQRLLALPFTQKEELPEAQTEEDRTASPVHSPTDV
jgi:hypothetical protein